MKKLIFIAAFIAFSSALCGVCSAYGARSMILVESSTGTVLDGVNCDEKLPMASTTKIMTALVVLEKADLSEIVSVSPQAVGAEGSSMYLSAGEQLTVEQLLYGLMLSSGNDAASALAIHIAGSDERFAALMNEKASALGLSSTHFANPSGLPDDRHYTTARELAAITAAALEDERFRRIVSTRTVKVPKNGAADARTLTNHNKLLSMYDGAVGVKTGFTKKSGRCLVSAAERDGVTLICVTLNDGSDWNDHICAFDLGFSLVERRVLAKKGEICIKLATPDGIGVSLSNREEISAVVRKNAAVGCIIRAPRFVYAPAIAGDAVGSAEYYAGGSLLCTFPLVLNENIAEPPLKKELLLSRIINAVKGFINDRIRKTAKISG